MPPIDHPAPKSRPRSTAKHGSYRAGFVFGILGFLGVASVGVVSTILTSRLYGVRIIGESALISAPVAALWVLSSVKEQQALIKEITGLPPRHPRVTQLFAVVFSFSSALTATVALFAAIVCWFVFRGPLHAPELIAPTFVSIAGYVIITNTSWNIDSILSAFVAGRQIFWVRLHEVLSFIVIVIAIGVVWRSVWGLVIATIGASLTSLIHRLIAVHPFVRAHLTWGEYRIGLRVLPELLRFGAKATPGQVAQGISQQGGIWAVGIVAPIGLVGAYSRALTIPQRLQQVSNRVNEVLYPTLVKRHTTGDGEGFDRALIDSIRYETIGMLLIAAAIGGAAHSVLNIFGPGFSDAASALQLLILYPVVVSVTTMQTQALWATNQPGRTSLIAVARLVISLTLLVVLTPKIGIVGPPIALLAGLLVVSLLSGIMLRPHMHRPLRATWPRRERFALVVAYAAGFAAAHFTEHVAPSAAGLLLSLLTGTISYAITFFVFEGINARDRHRLSEVVDKVRSWREQRADLLMPTSVKGDH